VTRGAVVLDDRDGERVGGLVYARLPRSRDPDVRRRLSGGHRDL
jgi:hypothetical protein